MRSQDGDVVTPLPVNVTVIDGETQTLCTNRDQLFDTLNATTGEVVVYIEGFDMTGKAWLGIGRGSGTCPMLVRKAAIIDEGDYSSADLDLARLLAQEAVIS